MRPCSEDLVQDGERPTPEKCLEARLASGRVEVGKAAEVSPIGAVRQFPPVTARQGRTVGTVRSDNCSRRGRLIPAQRPWQPDHCSGSRSDRRTAGDRVAGHGFPRSERPPTAVKATCYGQRTLEQPGVCSFSTRPLHHTRKAESPAPQAWVKDIYSLQPERQTTKKHNQQETAQSYDQPQSLVKKRMNNRLNDVCGKIIVSPGSSSIASKDGPCLPRVCLGTLKCSANALRRQEFSAKLLF
jgi:hypothetical protein